MTIWVPNQGIKASVTDVKSARNMMKYSEQFDNAVWTRVNLLVFGVGSVANATTAPNGTLTADLITESTTTGIHYIQQNIAVNIGITYTFSCFVKQGYGNRLLWLRPAGYPSTGSIVVDLADGSIRVVFGVISAYSVTSAENGFWLLSVTFVSAATGTLLLRCQLLQDTGGVDTSTYTGNGNSGVYVWGAQLEESSSAGGYIKTTTEARTATVLTLSKSVSLDTTQELTNYCRYLDEEGVLSDPTEFTWANTNQIAISDVLTHTPEYVFIGWGDDDIEFWNTWEIQ